MSGGGDVSLGATFLGDSRTQFLVWAPLAHKVEVHVLAPRKKLVPMESRERGYHHVVVDGVEPGSLSVCRLDEKTERPDPASRFQPQGVHGPSQVADPHLEWEDARWTGLPLPEYTIYELHVGTFTPEGSFDAIIPHLAELRELGITAIELMPVAQFPGTRNWGYDGVYPFAVQNSYGGPEGLKRLVNACHKLGMAKEQTEVLGYERDRVLLLRRWSGKSQVFGVFNFADAEAAMTLSLAGGRWRKLLDSADERWQGKGTSAPEMLHSEGEAALTLEPMSLALFEKEDQP